MEIKEFLMKQLKFMEKLNNKKNYSEKNLNKFLKNLYSTNFFEDVKLNY